MVSPSKKQKQKWTESPRLPVNCSSVQRAVQENAVTGDKGSSTTAFHCTGSLSRKMEQTLLIAVFLMIKPTCTGEDY